MWLLTIGLRVMLVMALLLVVLFCLADRLGGVLATDLLSPVRVQA